MRSAQKSKTQHEIGKKDTPGVDFKTVFFTCACSYINIQPRRSTFVTKNTPKSCSLLGKSCSKMLNFAVLCSLFGNNALTVLRFAYFFFRCKYYIP